MNEQRSYIGFRNMDGLKTGTEMTMEVCNGIKFAIHTLGCKVNQYESEKIVAGLKGLGWTLVDFPSAKGNVHIVNTCTVTAVASHKSRQLIRRAINSNQNGVIAVTGCYADSDKDKIRSIEGVDLVVGNNEKEELPGLISSMLGKKTVFHGLHNISQELSGNGKDKLRTRALVKVQDGCDNFCTYCIVPYVRGDLWSRPVGDVINEVKELASSGTKEIVLTGIHLGLFGAESNEPVKKADIGDLIERLIQIKGVGRIRLSSIELNEITPRIIELMSSSDKVCKHLHIPLQSGSDRVLNRMNRHYAAGEFTERTEALKRSVKDLAITTDVIVGFPGETETDFNETSEMIRRVKFSKLHVFKYSPREGTPAAKYPDQIPNRVKDERSSILLNLGKRLSAEFSSGYIGKELTVLIERENEELLTGISDNYIRVLSKAREKCEYIGNLAKVAVFEQKEEKLIGNIVGVATDSR